MASSTRFVRAPARVKQRTTNGLDVISKQAIRPVHEMDAPAPDLATVDGRTTSSLAVPVTAADAELHRLMAAATANDIRASQQEKRRAAEMRREAAREAEAAEKLRAEMARQVALKRRLAAEKEAAEKKPAAADQRDAPRVQPSARLVRRAARKSKKRTKSRKGPGGPASSPYSPAQVDSAKTIQAAMHRSLLQLRTRPLQVLIEAKMDRHFHLLN